ncbi:hypothetical protein ACHAWF_012914 [Thalassiosira exigua]
MALRAARHACDAAMVDGRSRNGSTVAQTVFMVWSSWHDDDDDADVMVMAVENYCLSCPCPLQCNDCAVRKSRLAGREEEPRPSRRCG